MREVLKGALEGVRGVLGRQKWEEEGEAWREKGDAEEGDHD